MIRTTSMALSLALSLGLVAQGCEPSSPEEVLAQVDEAFSQGKFKTGLKQLERYMLRNPEDFSLRLKRMDYILQAGGVGAVLDAMAQTGRKAKLNPSKDSLPGILAAWVAEGCKSPDAKLRLACAQALGDMGPQGDAQALAPLLDEGGELRRAALLSLARIRSKTAYRLLVDNLPKGDVPDEAFEDAVNTPAQRQLKKALSHQDPGVRRKALELLGKVGRGAIVQDVRKLLADPDPRVRAEAARTLGNLQDKASRARLEKMLLEDEDPVARAGAAAALGVLFDRASVPVLWKVFQDKDQPLLVRAEAAYALSGFRPSEDDENPAMTPSQVAAVRAAYRNPANKAEIARFAIAAAEIGDKKTQPYLREALLHEDPVVRKAAGTLLYQQEDKGVVSFLGDKLAAARSEAEVARVLRAIEEWQSGDALPLVRRYVEDGRSDMAHRVRALRLVARLGEQGKAFTRQVAVDPKAPVPLRVAALELLGDMGVTDAKGEALNMAKSASGDLEAAAVRAFGRLGTKEDASTMRAIADDNGGKALPIDDAGRKKVQGQQNPVLVHAIAALARWS